MLRLNKYPVYVRLEAGFVLDESTDVLDESLFNRNEERGWRSARRLSCHLKRAVLLSITSCIVNLSVFQAARTFITAKVLSLGIKNNVQDPQQMGKKQFQTSN